MAGKNSSSASVEVADKELVEEVFAEDVSSKKFVMLAPGVPGGMFAGSLISFKEGAKYDIDGLDDDFVAALIAHKIVVLVD
jgi:hypothetical protein